MPTDHRDLAGDEELIKRLFNKVYSAILSEKIFCPPETAVYLAAYACQAKFGPAKSLRNPVPPVKELLPKSSLDNHVLTIDEWEERISKWHLKLGNTSFLDAIVEYLDIAQDVELYGAPIFEVETKSHARKLISLDAVGLNIYENKRKPPTKRYAWSDIATFNAYNDRIEMTLTYESKKVVEFILQNQQTCMLLESLFKGSKELYSRRKKTDVSSNYIRRSESNSSMRMRPHKLTPTDLLKLEQQVTELELELPRRATNYEYAAWQVKDQLRQARGIEIKLSLNQPSTEETRLLLHRVAQIRVFLEQDIFKEKEPTDRLHRYRGNFAIRVGGTLVNRTDGYSSDVDSGAEINAAPAPVRDYAVKRKESTDQVRSVQPQPPSSTQNIRPSPMTSSSPETEGSGYVDHPYYGIDGKQSNTPRSSMPKLPEPLYPEHLGPTKLPDNDSPKKPATYDTDAYPKFPDRPTHSFTVDKESSSRTGSVSAGPGYPEARGSQEMDPPGSVTSPTTWKHVLRTPGQEVSDEYTKGRMHGRVIGPDEAESLYRPPVQPKPKVAPRGTADPLIVTPDYYTNPASSSAPGQDLKFSSVRVIQSGYTKKRVDLFEAL